MYDKWQPLSLLSNCHVEYNSSYSKLIVYISMIPIIMFIGLLFISYGKRDLKLFLIFIGAVLNASLCSVTKDIIKHPSPTKISLHSQPNVQSEFGMPSNHSMTMSYICISFWINYFRTNFNGPKFGTFRLELEQ